MALEHKVEGRTILIKGSVDEYVQFMEGVHRLACPKEFETRPRYVRERFSEEIDSMRKYEDEINRAKTDEEKLDLIEKFKGFFFQANFGFHRIMHDIDLGDKFGVLGSLILEYFSNTHPVTYNEKDEEYFLMIKETFDAITKAK